MRRDLVARDEAGGESDAVAPPQVDARTSGRRAALAGKGFAAQEAMMAPGGALSGAVQAKIADPAEECGPYKQRYADPAPYAWSVSYKRHGLADDHFDKGPRQDVTVTASYDWAMMNGSNTEPRVTGLMGAVTTVTREGRETVDDDVEKLDDCSVEENVERFTQAAKDGERFARKGTRVTAKGPKTTDEADVAKCS